MLNKLIYSNHRLFLMNIRADPNCRLCGDIETTQHLLFDCSEIGKIWEYCKISILDKLNLKIDINLQQLSVEVVNP